MSTHNYAGLGDRLAHLARRSAKLTGTGMKVAVALLCYANKAGESWPSAATLADILSIPLRSAERGLAELESAGLLSPGDRVHRSRARTICPAAAAGEMSSTCSRPDAGVGIAASGNPDTRVGIGRNPDVAVGIEAIVSPDTHVGIAPTPDVAVGIHPNPDTPVGVPVTFDTDKCVGIEVEPRRSRRSIPTRASGKHNQNTVQKSPPPSLCTSEEYGETEKPDSSYPTPTGDAARATSGVGGGAQASRGEDPRGARSGVVVFGDEAIDAQVEDLIAELPHLAALRADRPDVIRKMAEARLGRDTRPREFHIFDPATGMFKKREDKNSHNVEIPTQIGEVIAPVMSRLRPVIGADSVLRMVAS